MADIGVIALEPVGLARLEEYLTGLDRGFRGRAAEVADAAVLAGFGEPPAAADLLVVAGWSRRTADELRWRRALLEGMEVLPVSPFRFAGRDDLRQRAEDLAARLVEAIEQHPPSPGRVRALLAELARGAATPTFVATVVEGVEAWRVDDLVALADELGLSPPAGGGAVRSPAVGAITVDEPDPTDESLLEEARALLVDLLPGDSDLAATVRDVDLALLDDGGRLLDCGVNLVRAGRALRRSPVPRLGPVGVVGAAADVAAFVADPTDVHLLDATSSMLGLVAPMTGPAAPVAYLAAAGCSFLALLVATAEMSESQRDDFERRYNPGTGETTFPGGNADSPHLDPAGVPLDSRYG